MQVKKNGNYSQNNAFQFCPPRALMGNLARNIVIGQDFSWWKATKKPNAV